MTKLPIPPDDPLADQVPPDDPRAGEVPPEGGPDTDEERTFGQKFRAALREACDELLRSWWIVALIVAAILATWAVYSFLSTRGPGDVWRRIPEEVGKPP